MGKNLTQVVQLLQLTLERQGGELDLGVCTLQHRQIYVLLLLPQLTHSLCLCFSLSNAESTFKERHSHVAFGKCLGFCHVTWHKTSAQSILTKLIEQANFLNLASAFKVSKRNILYQGSPLKVVYLLSVAVILAKGIGVSVPS